MHLYLNRVCERYGLTNKDIFKEVYPEQWRFYYNGYLLSWRLPEKVKQWCVQKLTAEDEK